MRQFGAKASQDRAASEFRKVYFTRRKTFPFPEIHVLEEQLTKCGVSDGIIPALVDAERGASKVSRPVVFGIWPAYAASKVGRMTST